MYLPNKILLTAYKLCDAYLIIIIFLILSSEMCARAYNCDDNTYLITYIYIVPNTLPTDLYTNSDDYDDNNDIIIMSQVTAFVVRQRNGRMHLAMVCCQGDTIFDYTYYNKNCVYFAR